MSSAHFRALLMAQVSHQPLHLAAARGYVLGKEARAMAALEGLRNITSIPPGLVVQ